MIASDATTKNHPADTDIIMFQISGGTPCGTSNRQNRCHAERWYIRAASVSSTGTVRKDWYRLNVIFQACEVKIAKIAAHSTPSSRPGNSAINPVTVIDKKPRTGTDCKMSSTGIRIFSACRLFAASAAYGKLKASDTTRAAAIRNTVRSAYSGSRHGSRLIDNGSPSW